jgi:serine/threonine-protein kinase
MTQPRTPPASFDLVGVQLGGFEIIKRLRAGGMATLYVGKRSGASGFTRKAAIKVIHPHLAIDDRIVRMFVDEARICSQLNHPNIVHVEDFGHDAGVHFLAMEFIDGCSLRGLYRWLAKQERPLPVPIATRIVMDVAAGLHAAHAATGEDGAPLAIIHRDISPSNILLSRTGHVKIIDFGIAKARNRLVETESHATVKGKLKYMAPEQATRGSSVDHRCDLFALGVVYWELLAGRELFRAGNDTEGLAARLRGDPIDPPSVHNADVPPALDAIVLSMVAFVPEARIASAGEIRAQLAEKVPEALAVDASDIAEIVTQVRGEGRASVPSLESGEAPQTQPTMRLTGSDGIQSSQPDLAHGAQSLPPQPAPRRSKRLYYAAGGAVVALAGILWWVARGEPEPSEVRVAEPAVEMHALPPAPAPAAPSAPPPAETPAPAPAPTPTPAPAPIAEPPPKPATRTVAKHVASAKPKAPTKATKPEAKPASGLVRTSSGVSIAGDSGTDAAPAATPRKEAPKHVGKTPLADSFGD